MPIIPTGAPALTAPANDKAKKARASGPMAWHHAGGDLRLIGGCDDSGAKQDRGPQGALMSIAGRSAAGSFRWLA
jgi:hypothetical protein